MADRIITIRLPITAITIMARLTIMARAITVASRWARRPSLAAFSIAPADVIGMAAAGDAAVPSPAATREVRPSPARTRAAAAMQASIAEAPRGNRLTPASANPAVSPPAIWLTITGPDQ